MIRPNLSLVSLLALTLLIAACNSGSHPRDGSVDSVTQKDKEIYTCPMHPSVVSDHPGACPICGMALVKRSKQKALSNEEKSMLQKVTLSPTQRIVANITAELVRRRTIDDQIHAVGVVDYAEPLQSKVSAHFRGRIEKMLVANTGAIVRKGMPLFEIYSPALYSTEQDYLLTTRKIQGSDSEQRPLAQAARDRLMVNYGMTDRQIDQLVSDGVARPSMTFLSPAAGTVLRKLVTEGQYVNEGDILYELADLSRLWVYLEVSEDDARFIRIGQPVTFESEMYPAESFHGQVTFIDPVLTAETRTVRVRTEVVNSSKHLMPQMYVQSTIASRSRSAVTVPAGAVIQTGRRNVVWVETSPNTFEPRDVSVGVRGPEYCEITSGLNEGEAVAATGGFLIDSESLLQSPSAKGSAAHAPGHGQQAAAVTTGPSVASTAMRYEPKVATSADNAGKTPGHVSTGSGVQKTVRVMVDAEYSPSTIVAERGRPLRIIFHRMNDAECSKEVLFKDFGIRKTLAPNAETEVTFIPNKSGTFHFSCGMGMLNGTLIVKK